MIVPAVAADAEAIAALHRALFDEPWTAADIRDLVAAPTTTAFLARDVTDADPTTPVGFIIGRVVAGEAEILSIGVAAGSRRRGLGAALVEALAVAARQAGATRLFLEVAIDNAAALALYGSIGFAPVGRRRGYYQRHGNRPVDAVAMALQLD